MSLKNLFDRFRESPQKPLRAAAAGYDVATLSKVGGRPVNEDCVGTATLGSRRLLSLADGLGGHGKGDEASRTAVMSAAEVFARGGGDPEAVLTEMFTAAQNGVMERQEKQGNSSVMKTTLSLVIIEGASAWYGHIGDSRIYFFDNRRYDMHTLDHSVPQMLAASGEIKEKDIRGHADRNRLLRVIGIEWDEPRYELADKPRRLYKNDAILLCSDGFWELITERQMQAALTGAGSAEEWLGRMERCVLDAGKGKNMDNYSAVAVIAN